MSEPREWTDEEKRNAMTYGVCGACREPRFSYFRQETIDGETVSTFGIDCPNGHGYVAATEEITVYGGL